MALVVKNPPANAGDVRNVGLIPGSRRSPGEVNGNPLQYSCLENPMYRGAWQATVHRVPKSQTWLGEHIPSYKGGPSLRTTSSLKALLRAHILCLVTQHLSDSVWPHRPWPIRHLCPWNSPGKYWSELPCLPRGDLSNPGMEPRFPALQADSLLSEPPEKPS